MMSMIEDAYLEPPNTLKQMVIWQQTQKSDFETQFLWVHGESKSIDRFSHKSGHFTLW